MLLKFYHYFFYYFYQINIYLFVYFSSYCTLEIYKNYIYIKFQNKLILQQVKMSQNTLTESPVILKSLIGGLERCWGLILKFDTEIIPSLSNEQVLKLTHLLLADMVSNANNFNKWVKVLHKNDLKENKRLMIFILTGVFTQIGYLATEGITKSISKYLNAVSIYFLSIFKYII